jgi:hypothetical protein
MMLVKILLVVISFVLGFLVCYGAQEKPKGKKLEEISDRELFMLQCKVFDEISNRGAKLIEPFEEFGGEDGYKENKP